MAIQMTMRFPRAWLWLVDETIPNYVKKKYSPRESWKDKPFSKEDAQFFFKGVEELSDLFTEDRLKHMPAYFAHPKYRSAYLLYFLPLQAAKFLTLFDEYRAALDSALRYGRELGCLRIADLGVGPGTASISVLLWLLDQVSSTTKLRATPGTSELPPIELYWFDTQDSVMKDGIALVEEMANQFPKLRGKVTVHTFQTPWWKATSELPHGLALTLMGHILNETSSSQQLQNSFWNEIFEKTSGGGTLVLEPATRKTAQQISDLRDHLFETETLPASPQSIWGPCLHAGACPLRDGRDWCHFSSPVDIPGKWFKSLSKALGSERHWVKYSYLWFASKEYPAPKPDAKLRRVVSDPLSKALKTEVLICEPGETQRWAVNANQETGRGDVVKVIR